MYARASHRGGRMGRRHLWIRMMSLKFNIAITLPLNIKTSRIKNNLLVGRGNMHFFLMLPER